MSKFNSKSKTTKRTVNLAGGKAYVENPKLELVSILLTSFVADQFYRTAGEGIDRVKELINQIKDKMFVAKAALYARTKFGMRSISHVVAGELAKEVKGETWSKRFFDKIVYRVDDMAEILAYYLSNYGKPVPNAVKKGFRAALSRFDAYHLAKYRGERNDISLVDVVNLVHPKPGEKNADALKKLVAGELTSTDTWESKLTKAGQDAENDEEKEELKASAWKELVLEKKIGYFALLRNLRNILEQGDKETQKAAFELLQDEKLIKKSLVLPFRFTKALEEIEKISGSRDCIVAISKAIDIAVANVPVFEGKTLVALDCSGSMEGRPAEIGSLFAAILAKSNDSDLMLFSDSAEYRAVNPLDSTSSIAKSVKFASGGTNFHAIFEEANRKYDRIIILSDMQGWMSGGLGQRGGAPDQTVSAYRKKFSANPFIYSFDLSGYGSLQFPENNVFAIAGFSDKVFDLMKLLEEDRNAMVAEIEKVEI